MRKCAALALAAALFCLPTSAHAVVEPQPQVATGTTYYSNVRGWYLRFETWYYPKTSTTVGVTKQVLNATLSDATHVAPVPPFVFYNTSGTIGPVTVSVNSDGRVVYSSTNSTVYKRLPGGSVTLTWWPSLTTVRYHTYGQASVRWSQTLNSVYDPSLSSPNPYILRTATF